MSNNSFLSIARKMATFGAGAALTTGVMSGAAEAAPSAMTAASPTTSASQPAAASSAVSPVYSWRANTTASDASGGSLLGSLGFTGPARSASVQSAAAPHHESGWHWSNCTGDGNQGIQGRLSGAWAGPHKVASRKRVTINYSFARVSDFQTCRHGSGGVKARKIVLSSAFYVKGSKFSCDTLTLAGQGGSSVTCTFRRGTAVFKLKQTCNKATICRIRTGTMHIYAKGGAEIKGVRMQVSSRIHDHLGGNTFWNTSRF